MTWQAFLCLAWAFHAAAIQQWDFQQPDFKPHVFHGAMLDSGRCSLPVLDIFAPLPTLPVLEAEEARTVYDAVPAPDRKRWRAFLAHSPSAAGGGVPHSWVARRQQLLRAVAQRQRPVVLRGLLQPDQIDAAWRAEILSRPTTNGDARGDTPLSGPGAPPLQITYDNVATGGTKRDDGHGYGQQSGMPTTLRGFVAQMHADRDAELRQHASHPAPHHAFLAALPPQLLPHMPLQGFADALAREVAARRGASESEDGTLADSHAGGVARRQFLVGPAYASTLPHRHGPALQVLMAGAKRWFTDVRADEGSEPPGASNHSLCYCMGRCSALEVLAHRYHEWSMGRAGTGCSGPDSDSDSGGADDCVLRAAEAIYVPDGVCHAAVNCVDSVAFTYEFASERLAPLPPLPEESSSYRREEL